MNDNSVMNDNLSTPDGLLLADDHTFINIIAQAAVSKLDEAALANHIFERVQALQSSQSGWDSFSGPPADTLPGNPEHKGFDPQSVDPQSVDPQSVDPQSVDAGISEADQPFYLRMLSNENYISKLCFTSSLDANFIPGAVGLVRSIRKFYSDAEADIILFIDCPTRDFRRFCELNSVELHLFNEVEEWVRPLVYEDPRYVSDSTHFYHPDFQLKPGLQHHLDRVPQLGPLRHMHPLNVKAYCTGYCLCIKNYRHVVHIDCDAFVLSRVDTIFNRFSVPGTVVAFDDGADELKNLEVLFDVRKPSSFAGADYGFNAGVVFYVNNRAIKQLARDFMFYIESCYHFTHAGHFADQGVLRALVAKHHLLGDINFHKVEAVHWNPTWSRADHLAFDPQAESWQNEADGGKQYIWHGAGGEKLWTGKYGAASVNAAWKWAGGPQGNDWATSLWEKYKDSNCESNSDEGNSDEGNSDKDSDHEDSYYSRVMNDEDYIEKLCFTSCLDKNYRLGAMGLISSIRKFYSSEEADIVLFIDDDFDDFPQFCAQNDVELRYFREIDEWVQPLVYDDPLYANDQSHFYHPGFEPSPQHPHHKDRVAGFGKLHHLHPLNVKAYCTGYCLCVKNYRHVVHIDCDAFLLSRIDAVFEEHGDVNSITGFEDDEDDLINLEAIFKIKKPETFRRTQFGFNAGIVFYVNGRGTKAMIRDFMFFTESCYHYQYAGSYHDGDQGLIRAVVGKHDILGNIRFYREDNVNWNPTWKRCEELVFDAGSQSWTNLWNGRKQHIWHSPVFGGFLGNRLWTRRYPSASVNAAWRWIGGEYETWKDVSQSRAGDMPRSPANDLCVNIASRVASHLGALQQVDILELGTGTGRTAVAWASLFPDYGFNAQIDTCDSLKQASDLDDNQRDQNNYQRDQYEAQEASEAHEASELQETILDNIQRFGFSDCITFHKVNAAENLAARFGGCRYDFLFVNTCRTYAEMVVSCTVIRKLAKSNSVVIGVKTDAPEVAAAVQDVFGSSVDFSEPGIWIVRYGIENIQWHDTQSHDMHDKTQSHDMHDKAVK